MPKKTKQPDPFATREAAKYDRPIPSREFVLDYLRESIGPLTHEEICAALTLTEDEQTEYFVAFGQGESWCTQSFGLLSLSL